MGSAALTFSVCFSLGHGVRVWTGGVFHHCAVVMLGDRYSLHGFAPGRCFPVWLSRVVLPAVLYKAPPAQVTGCVRLNTGAVYDRRCCCCRGYSESAPSDATEGRARKKPLVARSITPDVTPRRLWSIRHRCPGTVLYTGVHRGFKDPYLGDGDAVRGPNRESFKAARELQDRARIRVRKSDVCHGYR